MSPSTSPYSKWKKPDEVMALHKLKKRKRALKERMQNPNQGFSNLSNAFGKFSSPDFSRLLNKESRMNPFAKNRIENKFNPTNEESGNNDSLNESMDGTLFQLIGLINKNTKQENSPAEINFENNESNNSQPQIMEQDGENYVCKYLPVDWALKTKVRFMSPKPFAWSQKLKASEEASGITGFARCLDTSKPSSLDTSHHARFHQHCLYWQHPVLPWISLFPRTSGRVAKNNAISSNEEITKALQRDWTDSFRSLYQLLRARQCPYFYVCANSFTCLFCAAGIGDFVETSVFITPTTRGLRQIFKQEEIDFTMPLKNKFKRKHNNSSQCEDEVQEMHSENSISKNNSGTTDSGDHSKDKPDIFETLENNDSADEDDDLGSEEWLKSLGVNTDEIQKINNSQIKLNQATEVSIDHSTESLVSIQGTDAQAFFNFLLNCKSCISPTGIFGGIPPTLLAPTTFYGGTLQSLKVHESIVLSEDGKYHSIELRGPILPTAIHSLCSLFKSNSNSFSVTFANFRQSTAFSDAAEILSKGGEGEKKSIDNIPNIFGRENLSDCGLNAELLQIFCSSKLIAKKPMENLRYCSKDETYIWS